jgi:drug/metabolite transporter (DMT)-like permease
MLVVAGLAAAFATSVLYACAVGLQALEARETPHEHGLRLALLTRLVRRPRWIVGTVLALLGWVAQVGALLLIPLTLVEPTLATSIVVLLVIGARVLDEPVGRREIAGVLAVTAGIGLLAWAAPPRETAHDTGPGLIAALATLSVLALVPYALSLVRRPPAALVIAVGAGMAYAIDGLATKFFADDVANSAWLSVLFWGAGMGLAAGIGTLSEMTALQRRPATQVAPIILALTTLVPVALAPVLANEAWSSNPWLRAALVVSILLIVGGAGVLAMSRAVGSVLEEARDSGNGTASSDLDESSRVTLSTVESEDESDESSVSTTTSPA